MVSCLSHDAYEDTKTSPRGMSCVSRCLGCFAEQPRYIVRLLNMPPIKGSRGFSAAWAMFRNANPQAVVNLAVKTARIHSGASNTSLTGTQNTTSKTERTDPMDQS
jgi:hypothetical protein